MNEILLVFLFGAGQVQFATLGQNPAMVQTIADTEEAKPSFLKKLNELTNKPDAKVKLCAIVPTTDFTSSLQEQLASTLAAKAKVVPSVWQANEGVIKTFKLKPDAKITFEDANKFCKQIAPVLAD